MNGKNVDTTLNIFDLLSMPTEYLVQACSANSVDFSQLVTTLPFRPATYRDFMLYEKHAIDAARGFVKKYLPQFLPIVSGYEKLFNRPFPKLKPAKRYYQYPIYYMGNHLNIVSEKTEVAIPEYIQQRDYELEVAAFITNPLKNTTVEQAREAIGGFLILNDFSARDVQLDDMKAKNFATSLSSLITCKNRILAKMDSLIAKVYINNELVVTTNAGGKLFSFEEAIAFTSWEEQPHRGEIFGSGTIPGCTGIKNGQMLNKGDTIRMEVEHLGILENTVV